MQNILLIAAGGAIGASLRYVLGLMALKLFGKNSILTGTVFANLAGCFCAGFVLAMTVETDFIMNSPGYLFFSTGIIGSLSTFSTFVFELVTLVKKRSYTQLAVYFTVQILIVLLFTLFGFIVYERIFGSC